MFFLSLLDTVHATLIGFSDVTISTALLREMLKFSELTSELNQPEAINLTNFLELSMHCLYNFLTNDPPQSNSEVPWEPMTSLSRHCLAIIYKRSVNPKISP